MAVWSTPVVVASVTSPAGALTGVPTPPTSGQCRTVSNDTVVEYNAPSGFVFTARAVSTSCASTIALTTITPATSVTLSFPKQTVHYVRLVLESVPVGACYLAVFEVTSPEPNRRPCNINLLVGSATCASPVTGSPCTPIQRLEP